MLRFVAFFSDKCQINRTFDLLEGFTVPRWLFRAGVPPSSHDRLAAGSKRCRSVPTLPHPGVRRLQGRERFGSGPESGVNSAAIPVPLFCRVLPGGRTA